MLQILGKRRSINVRKVLWTCDELGLAYAHDDWAPDFQPADSPQLLALNPNGLAPVLIDEHGPLWESNTICRYLAHRQGDGALLPADPRGRAQVEQWMDWQATELNSSWRYAFMALARETPGFSDAGQIAASTAAWNRAMSILDHQLRATGAYVTGEHFTLADIVLGLSAHRWAATPIAHADLPAVRAYYDRLSARDAFPPHARADLP